MTGDHAHSAMSATALLGLMRSRRVCRAFTDRPVERGDIEAIIEAARWAPSAGNIRLHRFLVVQDPRRIRLIQAVSPGMWVAPPALIVICTDLGAAAAGQVQVGKDHSVWIDVGTAAMNMMLQAHALGLGSSPATSFSPGGLRVVLQLPDSAIPEFILQIGHRAPELRVKADLPARKVAATDLTYWEDYRVATLGAASSPPTAPVGDFVSSRSAENTEEPTGGTPT